MPLAILSNVTNKGDLFRVRADENGLSPSEHAEQTASARTNAKWEDAQSSRTSKVRRPREWSPYHEAPYRKYASRYGRAVHCASPRRKLQINNEPFCELPDSSTWASFVTRASSFFS